jgi:hypothetical protein
MHGSKEICIKVLIEKPEGKTQFGRSRHRCKDNSKMNFKEITMGKCGLGSTGS